MSSEAHRSRRTPPFHQKMSTLSIEERLSYIHPSLKSHFQSVAEALSIQSQCYQIVGFAESTLSLQDCWRCLTKLSLGVIILDNIKLNSRGNREMVFYLFAIADFNMIMCGVECGEVSKSTDCSSERERIKRLSPPHNVVNWIEGVEAAQFKNDKPYRGPNCFLVFKMYPDACTCFKDSNEVHLSAFRFLVSLDANQKGPKSFKCAIKYSLLCQSLDLLPNAICEYDHKIVNLRHAPKFETSTLSPVVVAVKWTSYAPDDASETAAFRKCSTCLARKHKVVLVSIVKRYLWLMRYQKRPLKCESCNQNLAFGPRFPYDQFLPQVLEADMIHDVEDVSNYGAVVTRNTNSR